MICCSALEFYCIECASKFSVLIKKHVTRESTKLLSIPGNWVCWLTSCSLKRYYRLSPYRNFPKHLNFFLKVLYCMYGLARCYSAIIIHLEEFISLYCDEMNLLISLELWKKKEIFLWTHKKIFEKSFRFIFFFATVTDKTLALPLYFL